MPAIQTIQVRRGTASAWTSTNPTLASGELGFETDTSAFKIGDGATAWTALGYGGSVLPSGLIQLTNGTANRVQFGAGSGPPTFTTRSAGLKLLLAAALSGTAVDYGIGTDTNAEWFSVPQSSGTYFFRWYAGTTIVMSLRADGYLNIIGQSKLGGYTIPASGAVTLSSANKYVELTGNANPPTLPAASGFTGVDFYLINVSTAAITLTANGTEKIGNTSSAASTYSIPAGATLHIVSNGTGWRIL